MEFALSKSVFAVFRLEGRVWRRVSDFYTDREPAERVALKRQAVGQVARYRIVEYRAVEEEQ